MSNVALATLPIVCDPFTQVLYMHCNLLGTAQAHRSAGLNKDNISASLN